VKLPLLGIRILGCLIDRLQPVSRCAGTRAEIEGYDTLPIAAKANLREPFDVGTFSLAAIW
jgi:hypothetical protein